jgi:hypothetical protein
VVDRMEGGSDLATRGWHPPGRDPNLADAHGVQAAVAGEERKMGGWRVGACYSATRGLINSKKFKLFNLIQNTSNRFKLDLIQIELSWTRNEVKYGFEGFEQRNNFLHRSFFRFEMDFKWKIRDAPRFKYLIEFTKISSSNFKFGWKLDKIPIFAPRVQLNSWREFEVQSRNFSTWIESLKLKSIRISFVSIRIWLTKLLDAWLMH